MLNQMIVSALANPLCEIPLTVAHFFEEQKKAVGAEIIDLFL